MATPHDKSKETKKEDPMSQNKQNRDTLGKDYDGPDEEESESTTEDKDVDPNTIPAGTPKDKKVERGRY